MDQSLYVVVVPDRHSNFLSMHEFDRAFMAGRPVIVKATGRRVTLREIQGMGVSLVTLEYRGNKMSIELDF